MTHQVEIDTAGWGNWPRLTCYTCGGATLLRRPYMNTKQWHDALVIFAKSHPSPTITELIKALEDLYENH